MRILLMLFLIPMVLFGVDDESLFAKAIEADRVDQKEQQSSSGSLATENPDISFILDFGAGWFSRKDHPEYGGHAIDHNGFTLQGLEMTAGAAVDPYFRFDLNFQFVGMHLEEAYLSTLALPYNLKVRAGMMNALFGRENNQHLHVLPFTNYSIMHTRFMATEHFSGPGVELSALLPLPWYFMITGQIFDTRSSTYFRSSSFASVTETRAGSNDGFEDFVYLVRGAQFFELSDALSLMFGVSASFGQSAEFADERSTLFGGDLYFKWRDLSSGSDSVALGITLEWIVRDTQISGDFLRDHGGYLLIEYQINRHWGIALRGDYSELLEGRTDETTAHFDLEQIRGSFALSWFPTHFSKIRIQYDLDYTDQVLGHVVLMQFETTVGAHSAHLF